MSLVCAEEVLVSWSMDLACVNDDVRVTWSNEDLLRECKVIDPESYLCRQEHK